MQAIPDGVRGHGDRTGRRLDLRSAARRSGVQGACIASLDALVAYGSWPNRPLSQERAASVRPWAKHRWISHRMAPAAQRGKSEPAGGHRRQRLPRVHTGRRRGRRRRVGEGERQTGPTSGGQAGGRRPTPGRGGRNPGGGAVHSESMPSGEAGVFTRSPQRARQTQCGPTPKPRYTRSTGAVSTQQPRSPHRTRRSSSHRRHDAHPTQPRRTTPPASPLGSGSRQFERTSGR